MSIGPEERRVGNCIEKYHHNVAAGKWNLVDRI
jgi:hypothetical protein